MPASSFDCQVVYDGANATVAGGNHGASLSNVPDKLADSPADENDSSSSSGSDTEDIAVHQENGVEEPMVEGEELYVPQLLDTSKPPPNLPLYQPSYLPFNHAYAGFGMIPPSSAQQNNKKPTKNGNNRGANFPKRMDRPPRSYSPISFEARNRLAELLREKEAALAESTARLDGVGELLARLRNPQPPKQRLIVADHGVPLVPIGEQLSVSTLLATAPDSGASSLSSACSTAPSSAPQISSAGKGLCNSRRFTTVDRRTLQQKTKKSERYECAIVRH